LSMNWTTERILWCPVDHLVLRVVGLGEIENGDGDVEKQGFDELAGVNSIPNMFALELGN
jgi:hypothetical protein